MRYRMRALLLTVLCNYIPLAEEGQNTRRAAMRKMPRLRGTALQALITCASTRPLTGLTASSLDAFFTSLLPYFFTSSCGKLNDYTARFCAACGAGLARGKLLPVLNTHGSKVHTQFLYHRAH